MIFRRGWNKSEFKSEQIKLALEDHGYANGILQKLQVSQ